MEFFVLDHEDWYIDKSQWHSGSYTLILFGAKFTQRLG
ncbi:hypothetical protein VME0621_00440 [Vibrio mediterranei]|uniref:Uncharacterized protein n=1 Tax=Vibrio thalassae TaxID=1243014 RepID=A0A240EQ60_9VIBR|nr:hypothetical protein VME0621_00440 [Vibrio mediterranei]SNX50758.1 hypothetical protein VTH8203_04432 [Vibrio thalassae]